MQYLHTNSITLDCTPWNHHGRGWHGLFLYKQVVSHFQDNQLECKIHRIRQSASLPNPSSHLFSATAIHCHHHNIPQQHTWVPFVTAWLLLDCTCLLLPWIDPLQFLLHLMHHASCFKTTWARVFSRVFTSRPLKLRERAQTVWLLINSKKSLICMLLSPVCSSSSLRLWRWPERNRTTKQNNPSQTARPSSVFALRETHPWIEESTRENKQTQT